MKLEEFFKEKIHTVSPIQEFKQTKNTIKSAIFYKSKKSDNYYSDFGVLINTNFEGLGIRNHWIDYVDEQTIINSKKYLMEYPEIINNKPKFYLLYNSGFITNLYLDEINLIEIEDIPKNKLILYRDSGINIFAYDGNKYNLVKRHCMMIFNN